MYAPFGCGALAGPKGFFNEGRPAMVGGGTVELVTMKEIVWSEAPEREEAGSPNLFGALALAKAIQMLQRLGMENVAAHERDLTRKTLRLLREIPGITIYGDNDPDLKQDRVGVIPILAECYGHGLLAAILSYEWGIGVRHGCFCAHSYVTHLFDLSQEDLDKYLDRVRKGDRTDLPGLVRISFGIYNTPEEIEYLALALREIMKNSPRFKYALNKAEGEYYPEGSSDKIDLSFLI
jgi:selenocysteine lyase/cysteine desulfurase